MLYSTMLFAAILAAPCPDGQCRTPAKLTLRVPVAVVVKTVEAQPVRRLGKRVAEAKPARRALRRAAQIRPLKGLRQIVANRPKVIRRAFQQN